MNDIWTFQTRLANRLLAWSVPNVLLGAILTRFGDPFWRGFGIQTAAWGAIDGLIALLGRRAARRRAAEPDAGTPQRQAQAAHALRRVLLINTGLDVLYVLSGLLLTRRRGQKQANWRGHGWGIVVQGAFLFFFDLLHARQ